MRNGVDIERMLHTPVPPSTTPWPIDGCEDCDGADGGAVRALLSGLRQRWALARDGALWSGSIAKLRYGCSIWAPKSGIAVFSEHAG